MKENSIYIYYLEETFTETDFLHAVSFLGRTASGWNSYTIETVKTIMIQAYRDGFRKDEAINVDNEGMDGDFRDTVRPIPLRPR